MLMFDLHCHSLFSDGELLPSELVRRLEVMNYKAVAITDHVDESNMEFVLSNIIKGADAINRTSATRLVPGVELTHVHPERIGVLVNEARRLGAMIVVSHGETVVEPVAPGTNRASIEAGVDILAHPGMIQDDDVLLAAQKGVLLEISGRKGHGLTNGHVASMALRHGADLVIDSDAHAPSDFMSPEFARVVGMGAGLSAVQVEDIYKRAWEKLGLGTVAP
jgi:histidinol phosphatase-like PHP family hydrolase